MISVEEAKYIIEKNILHLPQKTLPLTSALGLVLAADVQAITDIPNFRQSSMDGYAIKYSENRSNYRVVGEMAAGALHELEIKHDQASRIFTGAPLPIGADTIVMQEKVNRDKDTIEIKDSGIQLGQHVREKGAEIKAGMLAMEKGFLLTPAALGFLAGIGIAEVSVVPKPVVSIILTGNELQEPGKTLSFGQVYEANGVMLTSVLKQAGIADIKVYKAEDNLEILTSVLEKALANSDLILLTGGVSVGDYDFVLSATKNCEIQQQFHKIKQKPGKPLFFGTKQNQVIFGLPGNPSSVLSCFYQYVLPAIGKMMNKDLRLKNFSAKISQDYNKNMGLTYFLKGSLEDYIAIPLQGQESFKLQSFSRAACLIELAEEKADYKKGDPVKVHLIPSS